MQAVVAGESVSGVLAISFRIFTKATVRSERVSTLFFFSISLCFIFVCMGCHWYIRGHKVVVFFVKACQGKAAKTDDKEHEMYPFSGSRDPDQQSLLVAANEDSSDASESSERRNGEVGRGMDGVAVTFQNEQYRNPIKIHIFGRFFSQCE